MHATGLLWWMHRATLVIATARLRVGPDVPDPAVQEHSVTVAMSPPRLLTLEPELAVPSEARVLPPTVRAPTVNRTALVNRLRAVDARLVVITAPAGYGKTTLLAQWRSREQRPFAWVTLGPDENRPGAFGRALIEAVSRSGIDDPEVAELATGDATNPVLVRRLGRWLLATSPGARSRSTVRRRRMG